MPHKSSLSWLLLTPASSGGAVGWQCPPGNGHPPPGKPRDGALLTVEPCD